MFDKLLDKYKFIAREKKIDDIQWERSKYKRIDKRVFFIGVHNIEKDLVTPHPLTHFIVSKYENNGASLSHQRSAAYNIARFLNYCLFEVSNNDSDFNELKTKGLPGLKRKHFSRYISFRTSMGLQYSTVKQEEHYLESFYEYLQSMGLTEERYQVQYILNNKNERKRQPLFKDAFLNTKYPSKDIGPILRLKDFGKNKRLLVPEFISAIKETCPEIALAVCLQIYAGLRAGEVLNLTKNSIKGTKVGTQYIVVKDRQKTLFPHLTSSGNVQVKRPRHQQVLPSYLFKETYDQHMKFLKQQKLSNGYILFYNSKGRALTKDDYYLRFGKSKDYFIDKLVASGRYEDAEMLNKYLWSTHIGRGIFTNFLLDMNLTVTQIALARGDKSIRSALAYVDEKHSASKIQLYVNEFKNMESDYLGNIENISSFKDEV